MSSMSRRDFIKASGVLTAAGALATIDFGAVPVGRPYWGTALAAEPPADLSRDEVIASLTAGHGGGQVGIVTKGSPPSGPQAIALGPQGGLLVVDTWNRRVIDLDRTGTVRRHLAVEACYPLGVQATADGGMHILDAADVIELGATGTVIRRLPLNKEIAGLATGLASQGPEVLIEVEGRHRRRLTERGAPVSLPAQASDRLLLEGLAYGESGMAYVTRYGSPDPGARTATVEVISANAVQRRLTVTAKHGVANAEALGTDADGNSYVAVTSLLPNAGVDRIVCRFNGEGAPAGLARIPVSGRLGPPRKDVVLGPDGQVYALFVLADRALVVRLGFAERLPSLAAQQGLDFGGVLAGLARSLAPARAEATDRDSALQTAYNFYYHSGYCNASNYATCVSNQYGVDYTSGRPSFIWSSGVNYGEVPYQWGGYRSTSQFDSDLSGNKTAGDVNCTSPYVKSCAAGVDCSGFVQNCWGQTSQKYNDVMLRDYFCTGEVTNKQTDGLAADLWKHQTDGVHVRLHRQYTVDNTGALTYESTTGYGGRVSSIFYSWNDLSVYNLYRWRGW
ncbi:MAG: twin-arginine translocation signal domain-containing protein [Chloroflexi bacterium]|nr:twin-arginine translocation signal domain-containing protein [Chloroflexota bacterium]